MDASLRAESLLEGALYLELALIRGGHLFQIVLSQGIMVLR